MKITFHYTFLIIAYSFIITGHFANLIVFTSIILVHEMGHLLAAKISKLEVIKLTIYPYGGLLKLNIKINTKINKELLVAISGIIMQTFYFIFIFFLYQNQVIREYIYNLFRDYHTSILIFNILPIYPLDGSKVVNLLLYKILSYKKSNIYTIIISIITLFLVVLLGIYQKNYSFFLVVTILIKNIIEYQKNLKYLFNKFLLERYLEKIKFKKIIEIRDIKEMKKEKNHIIKDNGKYITEREILKKYFKK